MSLTQSLGLLFGKGTGLFHIVKLENDNLSIFTASACIRCQVPFSSKLYHPCLTKACVYQNLLELTQRRGPCKRFQEVLGDAITTY